MSAKQTTKASQPQRKTTAVSKQASASKKAAKTKYTALEAALRVLHEQKQAMNCGALIQAMAEKGYWTSPGGQTPLVTLYAAILREIKTKGKDSRFKKTAPGAFASR